jgi:hypothetical protein
MLWPMGSAVGSDSEEFCDTLGGDSARDIILTFIKVHPLG